MHRKVTKYTTPPGRLSLEDQYAAQEISESEEYDTAQHRSDYPEFYCDSNGAYTVWEDVCEEEWGTTTITRQATSKITT